VIDEQFSEGHSLLHRIDPRIKLCLAISFSFVIALSENRFVLYSGLLLGISLAVVGRLAFLHIIKRFKVILIFLLLLWISVPVGISGRIVAQIGPFSWTAEGIERVFLISIKTVSILLLIQSLLGTSTVFSLVHAMSHLGIPKKILYLSFLSYRYIHVINGEYQRLRNAMRIRGFRPKTDLHTYKSYGYLIGMLLIRSFERSERIHSAMLCRGFQGKFYLLDHFSLHRRDFAFFAAMMLILIGMGCVSWILPIP
jgi:cobalt/nickel transport system permease protein